MDPKDFKTKYAIELQNLVDAGAIPDSYFEHCSLAQLGIWADFDPRAENWKALRTSKLSKKLEGHD